LAPPTPAQYYSYSLVVCSPTSRIQGYLIGFNNLKLMLKIGTYLEKFVKLGLKNEETKKTIQSVLAKVVNFDIPIKSIKYNKSVVEVVGGSSFKSILHMKKSTLLDEFKKAGISVTDVR
jgi:hypothetical protein